MKFDSLELTVLTMFAVLVGFAANAIGHARPAPVVSVAEVALALDQAGIVVGAGRTVNGAGYTIAQRQITLDGPWVVVRILPRRYP